MGFLTDLATNGIGSLISGIGSIFTANKQAKSAQNQTQMMIDAQKQANEYNVQAQKDINSQNIAFQQGINDIMRSDAHNAIGIKKQDLINAGYSTANPELSGNSTASLGSPALTAPQVAPEYNSEMANIQQNAYSNLSSTLLGSATTMADIALKRAQAKESNSRATGQDIQNSWLDVQLKANYQQTLATIDNIVTSSKLNKKQIKKVTADIEFVNGQIDNLAQQTTILAAQAPYAAQKAFLEIDNLNQVIREAKSRILLNGKDAKLKDLDAQIKGIELKFARLGINFNSNDWISAISRIAVSGNVDTLVNATFQMMNSGIGAIANNISNFIVGSDGQPTSLFNKARSTVKFFSPAMRIGEKVVKQVQRRRYNKHT